MAERLTGFLLFLAVLISCKPSTTVQGGEELSGPEQIAFTISRILVYERTGPEDRQYVVANHPKLVQAWEKEAEKLLSTDSKFRWDQAREFLVRLQSVNTQIRNSEVYSELLPGVQDYSEKILELQKFSAEQKYSEALEILGSDTREAAKSAYFILRNLQNYQYRIPGLDTAMRQAQQRANTDVSFIFYAENEAGLNLEDLSMALRETLVGTGITGPFVTVKQYDLDQIDIGTDHLIEIKVKQVDISTIQTEEYLQEVENSLRAYKITEESMDIKMIFETTITDIGLNQVMDRSDIRIERRLENLVGSFSGDPGKLNDYQKNILNRPSMSVDALQLKSILNQQVVLELVDDIRDFYQNY